MTTNYRATLRVAVGVAALLCGAVFVRSNAGEVRAALAHAGSADPLACGAGVLVSVLAMLNRGALNHAAQRAVGLEVALRSVTRTAAAGFAAQKLVKPASVAGVAVFVADGKRRGHRGSLVAAACTLAALCAMVSMGCLLALTCVLLAVSGRLTGWWVVAAVTFVLYAGVVFALGVACCRPCAVSKRVWRVIARVPGCAALRDEVADGPPAVLVGAIAAARGRRAQLVRALSHAVMSKLLGMTMLLAGVVAAGVPVGPVDVVLAYATAMAASTVSLLPGGVGAVEASVVALLVSAGAPVGGAVLAVALFRLFDLWIPVLAGVVAARSFARGRNRDEDRDLDGDAVVVGPAPAFA